MAQSGNRPPRRVQSTRTANGASGAAGAGTGKTRQAPDNSPDSAAERARERLAQRNLAPRKQQGGAAQRARAAAPTAPRSKAEAAAAQRARAGTPPSRRGQGRGQSRASQRSTAMVAAIIGTAVVLVAVLVIVLVSVTNKTNVAKPTGYGSKLAPASLVAALAGVPPSSFTAAGTSTTSSGPFPQLMTVLKHQSALVVGGKPAVVYVGSEWCPYCAATRWPLTVALMRFGTFKHLMITKSGAATDEVYPGTNTLSYYGSSYSSPYITFLPTEQCTDLVAPSSQDSSAGVQSCNGYEPEPRGLKGIGEKSFSKYDYPPYETSTNEGGIPYVNIGNRWVEDGAFIFPTIMQGFSWSDIAQSLANPVAAPGQQILSGANYYSAMICKLTNDKPGSVCDMPVVKQAAAALPK